MTRAPAYAFPLLVLGGLTAFDHGRFKIGMGDVEIHIGERGPRALAGCEACGASALMGNSNPI
jgi:hypothetical protein